MKSSKRISVVGLGFVGLSTAVFFASKGYEVIASSNDRQKVNLIRSGVTPFFEPEIKPALKKTLKSRKLSVIVGREAAVLMTDLTFITVGTPSLPDGNADLTFIEETAKKLGTALKQKQDYHLFIIKSTVPPSTSESVVKPILERHSGKKTGEDFGLVMSPEFLREGSSLHDLANPDRVVIGEFDERSGTLYENLIKQIYGCKVPVLRMSLASAELSKYASNAFLATKISFINEIANLCERISGVDIVDIALAMGTDPRIGREFLRAGAGWGGSCFPKDTNALIALSNALGHEAKLTREAVSVNVAQANRIVELTEQELGKLKGKKIAVLGLSFKPNTDDIRGAASLRIINLLIAKGAEVTAFDPVAMDKVKKVVGDKIRYSSDVSGCLENADCCILVTEWDEFRKLKPEDFTKLMRNPILIDGRRIYDPKVFSKKLRLRAIGLGRTEEKW